MDSCTRSVGHNSVCLDRYHSRIGIGKCIRAYCIRTVSSALKSHFLLQLTPIDEFLSTSGHTFLCHLNIQCKEVPDQSHANRTLDFLSNLTPASALYNETVRRLRRHRRHIFHQQNTSLTPASTRTSNQLTNHDDQDSGHNRFVHRRPNETAAIAHKAHMNRYWKKYKSYMHNRQKVATALVANSLRTNTANQTPTKIAQLILNTEPSRNRYKCLPLAQYAILLSVVYVLFAMSTFHFLFHTESAVFTMTVMSAALPVSGIFWSLFELTTKSDVGKPKGNLIGRV